MLVTFIGGVKIFIPTRQNLTITLREDNTWQIVGEQQDYTGSIAAGSYRSMLLIVLAIKPPEGRTQHAVVWCDAVSPEDFSALHIRLAQTAANQLA